MEPNNDRAQLRANLEACSECGDPATAWAYGPMGSTQGRCEAHRPPPVRCPNGRIDDDER